MLLFLILVVAVVVAVLSDLVVNALSQQAMRQQVDALHRVERSSLLGLLGSLGLLRR